MKKLFVFCFLLLLICGNFIPCAYALGENSGWARIVKDYVYIYAEQDCSKQMFTLEKSYYVEILDSDEKILHVSVMQNESNFPQITGYVKRTDVDLCYTVPLTPYYPTERLTVTSDSATLRLSPSTNAAIVITATNTQKVSYYGRVDNDRAWYYVCFGDKFGYVDVNSVSAPNIQLHPTPLPTKQPTPAVTNPSDTTPELTPSTDTPSPTSEILLIVFVVLLAIGLTLALFLPGNIKKRNVFEQDI
ncbi:MAG: SH3 domain-containing protein [Clostridiales bacterium]|nr:SH3 domain-containing protein [Clostridiales bacterium]